MTRNFIVSWMLVLGLVPAVWAQAKPAGSLAAKPTITVLLPSIDALFEDLKMAFDLGGDQKEYTTLKETIEVFLVGIDTDKPSALRVYSNGTDLPYVLTVPISSQKQLVECLANLWDIDVKTMSPPVNSQLVQVPAAIRTKHRSLKIAAHERIIFKLYDGFLSYEAAAKQAHVGVQLAEARHAKGGFSVADLKGRDVVAVLEGEGETPAQRVQGFATVKKEILGALTQGETEEAADFALRQALTEEQVAELERFFSESSRIEMGWTTSSQDKNAKMSIDLAAVAGTPLEQSIEQLGQVADEFAGVPAGEGEVLSAQINFPLDAMRQQHLKNISKLARDSVKGKIDRHETKTKDQKDADKDLADLVFDAVDDVSAMGLFNAFGRVWSNADGTLTGVGATKVPDGAKFQPILQKFAARGNAAAVEMKVATEADVEIHKLTLPELQKEFPEVFPADGVVYIGTGPGAIWYALGDQALERLKTAIGHAQHTGSQSGTVADLKMTLLPFIKVLDKVRTRQEPEKPPRAARPRAKGDATTKEDVPGILGDLNLRKVALEAFAKGKDTLSVSLTRDDKQAKVNLQLDEGVIRFVGKAASRFVKDNLADE